MVTISAAHGTLSQRQLMGQPLLHCPSLAACKHTPSPIPTCIALNLTHPQATADRSTACHVELTAVLGPLPYSYPYSVVTLSSRPCWILCHVHTRAVNVGDCAQLDDAALGLLGDALPGTMRHRSTCSQYVNMLGCTDLGDIRAWAHMHVLPQVCWISVSSDASN